MGDRGAMRAGIEGEGRRGAESAHSCVHACTPLMSVCMEYERVVVCGERESRKKGEKEKGAPKDPPRTKWSPLILRRHCKVHPSPGSSFSFPPSCVSFSRCLSCILALSSFLAFLSRFLCLVFFFLFLSRVRFPLPCLSSRSRYSLMRMQNRRSFSG